MGLSPLREYSSHERNSHPRPPDEWRQTATLEDAVRRPPPGQDTTVYDASLRARIEAATDR